MLLLLLSLAVGCPTPEKDPAETGTPEALRLGLLQFHLVHNLEDDTCLAEGDCALTVEETGDVAAWTETLSAWGNTPVLHWDQGVPWSVFAVAPPDGEDAVSFYEERLDPELLAWIQAWGAWFASAGRGYLALSNLHGTRDSLAYELLPGGEVAAIGGACPDMDPEATFQAADGTSFQLGQAWERWADFLIAELHPDQVALLVEANLFKVGCPGQWDSLVSLYQATYDAVRADVGPDVQIFATLSLPPLLGYTDGCQAELSYVPCDQEPPAPAAWDPEACFPGDPAALDDLSRGDRMDALALSFYPDGLPMAPAGVDDARMRVFFDTTGTDGTCDAQARLPAWVDPLDALGGLGWDGPVGLAETSSRSCPSMLWYDDGTTQATVEVPGSEDGQVAWLTNVLGRREELAFVYQSFLRDYPPLGLWLVEEGVLDSTLVNLFNLWPCSGLQGQDGSPKAAQEVWRSALP